MAKSVIIYSEQEIQKIERACKIAAATLDFITPYVQEGVTTEELNGICEDYMRSHGTHPAPLTKGFPKAVCISLNNVVCHGIPGKRVLRKGDILNIDVSLSLDGWYADNGRMYYVGPVSKEAHKLTRVTYEAMLLGIAAVRPGARLGALASMG